MKDMNCAYCAEGALVGAFGIKIMDLSASQVYLFREPKRILSLLDGLLA